MKPRALDPRIDAFLEAAPQTHDWGPANCGFFIADYVEHRLGRDPAADLRGIIGNEGDARALIERERGFLGLVHRRMVGVGLKRRRFGPAQMGDVALLLLPTVKGVEPIGAIALGRGRWAVRTSSGLRFTRGLALASWALPHG